MTVRSSALLMVALLTLPLTTASPTRAIFDTDEQLVERANRTIETFYRNIGLIKYTSTLTPAHPTIYSIVIPDRVLSYIDNDFSARNYAACKLGRDAVSASQPLLDELNDADSIMRVAHYIRDTTIFSHHEISALFMTIYPYRPKPIVNNTQRSFPQEASLQLETLLALRVLDRDLSTNGALDPSRFLKPGRWQNADTVTAVSDLNKSTPDKIHALIGLLGPFVREQYNCAVRRDPAGFGNGRDYIKEFNKTLPW